MQNDSKTESEPQVRCDDGLAQIASELETVMRKLSHLSSDASKSDSPAQYPINRAWLELEKARDLCANDKVSHTAPSTM